MSTLSTAPRAARRRSPSPTTLVAVLCLVWLVAPLLPMLLWAGADRWSAPGRLPQDWGLDGWRDALAAGVLPAAGRSLLLGTAVAVLAVPLGAAAGRALGWRELRRPVPVALVLLAPVLLPPFAVSLGLDVVVLRLGIPDVVAVVIVLVAFAVPYCAYTVAAAYAEVDPRLEEQARALGASPRQARWRVGVPAVRSSLVIAAALAFLVGWSDYVVTLLIGGGQVISLPVLLGSAAAGSGNDPAVAALGLATAAPPVLLLGVLGLGAWLRRR